MRHKSNYLVLTVIFLLIFFWRFNVFAQTETPTPTPTPENSGSVCKSVPECAGQNIDCSKCIDYLTSKKNEASGKAKSLSSEISVMNKQINLTELRIKATEEKIVELQDDIAIARGKISNLQNNIDKSTKALIGRISAVYEIGRIGPWEIFLTSNSIKDAFNRLKYLRIVQISDKKRVYVAQQAKVDYQNQKKIFETKEDEAQALANKLEGYTKQLEQEKIGKQQLLQVTRNDEARYQRLLAEARAERAIVLGGGNEVFLKNVSVGDSIGTIISGASGCSSGTHLHLSIYQGTSARDPSDYLSSKGVSYSYPDSQYGYYGTINPHGSDPWPLDDPILVNQGYGSHGFAKQFYPSGFHDGIDIEGGSLNVKSMRPGKMYEGSYRCSNGTLTYAKVEHDGGLISWYLHIIPH